MQKTYWFNLGGKTFLNVSEDQIKDVYYFLAKCVDAGDLHTYFAWGRHA